MIELAHLEHNQQILLLAELRDLLFELSYQNFQLVHDTRKVFFYVDEEEIQNGERVIKANLSEFLAIASGTLSLLLRINLYCLSLGNIKSFEESFCDICPAWFWNPRLRR